MADARATGPLSGIDGGQGRGLWLTRPTSRGLMASIVVRAPCRRAPLDLLAEHAAAAGAQAGLLPLHAGDDPAAVGDFRRAEPHDVAGAKALRLRLVEGLAG